MTVYVPPTRGAYPHSETIYPQHNFLSCNNTSISFLTWRLYRSKKTGSLQHTSKYCTYPITALVSAINKCVFHGNWKSNCSLHIHVQHVNNGLLGGGVGVRVGVGVRGQRKVKGQKKVKALLVEILDITGFLLEGKRAIIRQLYSEPFTCWSVVFLNGGTVSVLPNASSWPLFLHSTVIVCKHSAGLPTLLAAGFVCVVTAK